MDTLLVALVLVGGFLLGAVLTYSFLYSSLKIRFEAQFREQLRQSREQVREETLKRSGAILKGQIGERFAPFVEGFGYEPADARFLGSPIDYVVFDGLTDGQIRAVAFVEVKTGAAQLTPFQRQVEKAIKDKRIDWRVVQLPE